MGASALRIAGITPAIESLGHVVREIGTVTAGGFILFGLWTRPVAFLLAGGRPSQGVSCLQAPI